MGMTDPSLWFLRMSMHLHKCALLKTHGSAYCPYKQLNLNLHQLSCFFTVRGGPLPSTLFRCQSGIVLLYGSLICVNIFLPADDQRAVDGPGLVGTGVPHSHTLHPAQEYVRPGRPSQPGESRFGAPGVWGKTPGVSQDQRPLFPSPMSCILSRTCLTQQT